MSMNLLLSLNRRWAMFGMEWNQRHTNNSKIELFLRPAVVDQKLKIHNLHNLLLMINNLK